MYSKSVTTQTKMCKANWTREMVDDLNNFNKMYEYIIKNQTEKVLIEKYFNVVEVLIDDNMNIYYLLSKKELRKIKLLTLNDDELSLLLKKIFKKSEIADAQQMMERNLSRELAKEIDNSILFQVYLDSYLKK